jgi:hypothetical protein
MDLQPKSSELGKRPTKSHSIICLSNGPLLVLLPSQEPILFSFVAPCLGGTIEKTPARALPLLWLDGCVVGGTRKIPDATHDADPIKRTLKHRSSILSATTEYLFIPTGIWIGLSCRKRERRAWAWAWACMTASCILEQG